MEIEGKIMYTLSKMKHKLILKVIKEIYFIFFLQFINIFGGKFHYLSKANAKINLNYQMLL